MSNRMVGQCREKGSTSPISTGTDLGIMDIKECYLRCNIHPATGCEFDTLNYKCTRHTTRNIGNVATGDGRYHCWSFPNYGLPNWWISDYVRTTATSVQGKTAWGDWRAWEHCPNNGRVVGFNLRAQALRKNGDNTALNTIKLKCQDGSTIMSFDGHWGEYQGWGFCASAHSLNLL